MKRSLPTWFSLLAACSAASDTPEPTPEPGPPVCEEGPSTPGAVVDRRAEVLGPSVNAIEHADGALWIVESGSNTVRQFDPKTSTTVRVLDIGNERNPWAVWVGPENVWVTNFLANTVSVVSRETGTVVEELAHDSFDGPAGITGTAERVYVGNTEFRGENEYGPGSVTIIDRGSRTVFGSRQTARQNPQALDVVGGRVVVVDAGAIAFGKDGAEAASEGAVELWTETEEATEPAVEVAVLPLVEDRPRVGIPGRPAHRDGTNSIYFASGTAPVVFVLDLETVTWRRGSDDPIRLYETDRDALHHAAMGDDGVLYVTSFNQDALYLIDTTCDELLGEPIELDASDDMLAGPHGVVPIPTDGGVDAWFVLSLANELGRVRLNHE